MSKINLELPNLAPNPFLNGNLKIEVAPVKHAINSAMSYLTYVHEISPTKAKKVILNRIRKQGKDPIITINRRGVNRDKNIEYIKLTQYIQEAYEEGHCLVPSLTRYSKSEEDGGVDSLHKGFTTRNLVERAKAKHAAADAYAKKEFWEASELTNLQKTLKLLNNAMSGAFASPSTIHYNPSAHYTLTSITRTTASTGNVMTEMLSFGNRCYFDIESVIAHLSTTILEIDHNIMENLLEKYNLHIPTVDEVMKMIKWSTDLYWTGDDDDHYIYDYIKHFTDIERCLVMYNNDLYHTFLYNPEMVSEMLIRLGQRVDEVHIRRPIQSDYYNAQPEYVKNLMVHICLNDLAGVKFKPEEYEGTQLLDVVTATMCNINEVMFNYADFFSGLFGNDVLPINVGSTKDMIRRCIVLSDTDSTAGTYEHWVKMITGNTDYNQFNVGIATAVLTITGLSIENAINVFTTNMNIGSKSKNKIAMKNEFFWTSFAIGSATKHYFAEVAIKEGFVFETPELELKGSGFILSKTPLEFRKKSEEMYIDILNTRSTNKQISIVEYIQRIVRVEQDIMDRVVGGDYTILTTGTIKDKTAYKAKEKNASYMHYIMWKEVFEAEYGKQDRPPYVTVKYNLDLDKRGKYTDFIDGMTNLPMKQRLLAFMEKYDKKTLGTLQLPLEIVSSVGLPKDFIPVANVKKIIRNNCGAMYKILETLGFGVKDGSTLLEMGYGEQKWLDEDDVRIFTINRMRTMDGSTQYDDMEVLEDEKD